MRPQYFSRALVLPLLAGTLAVLTGCNERQPVTPPAPLVTVSPVAPREDGPVVSVRSLGARQTFLRAAPERAEPERAAPERPAPERARPEKKEEKPRRRRRPRRRAAPNKVAAPARETAPAPAPALRPAPQPVRERPAPAPPAEPKPATDPAPAPEPPKGTSVGAASFHYGSGYDPYRMNLPPNGRRSR